VSRLNIPVEEDMPGGWERRDVDGREAWFHRKRKWHVIAVGNKYALAHVPADSHHRGALLVKDRGACLVYDKEIISFNNPVAAAWHANHMHLDELLVDHP